MQPSQGQLPVDPCQLDQMDPNLLTTMSQVVQDTLSPTMYDPSFGALDNVSAPVSIPKNLSSQDELNDFVGDTLSLELMAATSDLELDETLSSSFGGVGGFVGDLESPLSPSLWSPATDGNSLKTTDFLTIDKSDPTLAELNLKREQSLLDNFVEDFDLPLLSPEEEASTNILTGGDSLEIPKQQWAAVGGKLSSTNATVSSSNEVLSSSFPVTGFKEAAVSMPVNCNFSTMWAEQLKEKEAIVPLAIKQEPKPAVSTLHDLLTQCRTNAQPKSTLPPAVESKPRATSCLSSSSPAESILETPDWQTNTYPQKQQNSEEETETISKTETTASEVFNPTDDVDSHDEGFDSEPEDTDHYDELTSDAESTVSDDFDSKRSKSTSNPPTKHFKKEKFFWQYNVQAKGPKISRLCLSPHKSDPHHLNKITDPVFSPGCFIQGIKHSGKARRGDGNDLNPNARKLFQIGQELRKLNRVINDLTPVSELPFNARPRSRKEKNKLASRACRLKKKAQHEANKLKLFGLEDEHTKLSDVLNETRKLIIKRMQERGDDAHAEPISNKVDNLMKENTKTKVAGCTSEYVNRILGSISEGKPMEELESN